MEFKLPNKDYLERWMKICVELKSKARILYISPIPLPQFGQGKFRVSCGVSQFMNHFLERFPSILRT